MSNLVIFKFMIITFIYISQSSITKKSFFPGLVDYYTFKPVAIGKELLVYYGDEYFTDMGYVVDTVDPMDSKCYY